MSLISDLKKALLVNVSVCMIIDCDEIINNTEQSKIMHLKQKHPNYYNLIQDSLTHHEIIDINESFV